MKMKKILSVLMLGAMAAGASFAETKIALNYRNGTELFKYVHKGDDGRNLNEYGNVYDYSGYVENKDSISFFNQLGWNGGKDNLAITQSGEILTVKATIQPTVSNDVDIFHIFTVTAELPYITLDTGWNGDGAMAYRCKKDADTGNEEGKVFETFKLGSMFTGSPALCADNQLSFNTGKNYYLRAITPKLGNTDAFYISATGVLMSDRAFDSNTIADGGNKGWSVFLNPGVKDLFEGEVFVKGVTTKDDVLKLVAGGYFKTLAISKVYDSALGGSVTIIDGDLQEYNVDLRTFTRLNPKTSITTFSKFAKLISKEDKTPYAKCDGAAVGALAGLTGFQSSQALWNMVAVRHKYSALLSGVVAVGHLTDLDSGFNNGRDSNDGTQIFVHPHVQLYANGNSTVTCGIVAGFGGIGADKDANKDIDIIVNVPILVRVKM